MRVGALPASDVIFFKKLGQCLAERKMDVLALPIS
jgi:hypothetical protein